MVNWDLSVRTEELYSVLVSRIEYTRIIYNDGFNVPEGWVYIGKIILTSLLKGWLQVSEPVLNIAGRQVTMNPQILTATTNLPVARK